MGLALAYPFHIDGAGRIAVEADQGRQLATRLKTLIATIPNERVMRSRYGAGIGQYLFDVNDPQQAALIQSQLRDAVTTWETGVVVDDVRLLSQDPAGGMIELAVDYHVAATGATNSLTIVVSSTATYGWPEGG